MRLDVIIHNSKQLGSAGVRIRYRRLAPAIERLGHAIRVRHLDEVAPDDPFEADAFLFCKCHDARAVVLAKGLNDAGRPVGIDVFDDYFSQRDDARLVHLRRWFASILPALRFALCATPAMAGRLGALAPGLRVHLLSDPTPPFDPDALADAAERKEVQARRSRVVEAAWFGMGDNAYFPVGLHDLAAWCGTLAEVRSAGFEPRLTVLTNRRALSPERAEAVARLPVPARLEEWSAEAEATLLHRSLVAFLPVNAQPFSTAKSLNRAVTALAAGAQVLTPGYPLYRPLGAFTYRSGLDLARDLLDRRLRLRRATAARLAAILARIGDADAEADALVAMLSGLAMPERPAGAVAPVAPRAVIHGVASPPEVRALVRAAGVLSVASPFSGTDRFYDVRVEDADGQEGARVVLTPRAEALLDPALQPALGEPFPWRGALARAIPLGDVVGDGSRDSLLLGLGAQGLTERIALYPSAMAATRALLQRLIPGVEVTLSETASPFAEARSWGEGGGAGGNDAALGGAR